MAQHPPRPTSSAALTRNSSSPTSPRPARSTSTCSGSSSPTKTTNAIYLRAFEEYLHHSSSCAGARSRRSRCSPTACAVPRISTSPPPTTPRSAAGSSAARRLRDPRHRRRGAHRGSARLPDRVLLRRRARRADDAALRPAGRGAIARLDHFNIVTPDVPARRAALRGPRLQGVRGHRGRRRDRLRGLDVPQGDRARRRAHRRRRPAPAPHRLRDSRDAARSCTSATTSARSASPTRSNAAPAATASRTRSTSTCSTPTATASRSTRTTTTRATPTTRVVTWDVHDNQRRDWWGTPGRAELVRERIPRARPRRRTRSRSSNAPTPAKPTSRSAPTGSRTRVPATEQGFKLGAQL